MLTCLFLFCLALSFPPLPCSLSVLYCLPRDVVLHWLPGWYTCSHSTHHLLDLNNSPYNHSLPHYSASFAIVSPLLCFVSSQSRNADFLKCVFPPVLPYFSPMIQIITLASATSLSLDNLPVYSSLFLTQTYSTYATCLESLLHIFEPINKHKELLVDLVLHISLCSKITSFKNMYVSSN